MPIKTIAAPSVEPVLLADAKLHLRVDGTDEDALIGAYITAARELAEAQTDRAYAEATYELVSSGFGYVIVLPVPPVTAVLSVKYLDADGVEQTIAPSNYVEKLDALPPVVVPADGFEWPATNGAADAVRVRFTAGAAPADVPQRVKLWMMLHVTAWYENRAAVSGAALSELPGVRALLDPERWSWF